MVDNFRYLGVIFNFNGNFHKCKRDRLELATRAMYVLISKCKVINLPIDMQLELFDRMITPVLTYGGEVWGYDNNDMLEKLHLRFCKYILNVKKSTSSIMVYGELGRFPVDITIKVQMVSYWAKLITGDESKLSVMLYQKLLDLYRRNIFKSKWLTSIQNTLNICGIGNIFLTQDNVNITWLKNHVQQSLKDQFIQKWHSDMFQSELCCTYRSYKEFGFERYLIDLPVNVRHKVCIFRMSNHKLPVEKLRHESIYISLAMKDFVTFVIVIF